MYVVFFKTAPQTVLLRPTVGCDELLTRNTKGFAVCHKYVLCFEGSSSSFSSFFSFFFFSFFFFLLLFFYNMFFASSGHRSIFLIYMLPMTFGVVASRRSQWMRKLKAQKLNKRKGKSPKFHKSTSKPSSYHLIFKRTQQGVVLGIVMNDLRAGWGSILALLMSQKRDPSNDLFQFLGRSTQLKISSKIHKVRISKGLRSWQFQGTKPEDSSEIRKPKDLFS